MRGGRSHELPMGYTKRDLSRIWTAVRHKQILFEDPEYQSVIDYLERAILEITSTQNWEGSERHESYLAVCIRLLELMRRYRSASACERREMRKMPLLRKSSYDKRKAKRQSKRRDGATGKWTVRGGGY